MQEEELRTRGLWFKAGKEDDGETIQLLKASLRYLTADIDRY